MSLSVKNAVLGLFISSLPTVVQAQEKSDNTNSNDIEAVTKAEKTAKTTWRDVFVVSSSAVRGDGVEANSSYQQRAAQKLEREMDKLDEKSTFKGLYRYIDNFNDRMADLLDLDRDYVTSPFNEISLDPNIKNTQIISNELGFEIVIGVGEDFNQMGNVIFGANTGLYRFVNNDMNNTDLENIKKEVLLNYRANLQDALVEKYPENIDLEFSLIDLGNAVIENEDDGQNHDLGALLLAAKNLQPDVENEPEYKLLEKAILLSNIKVKADYYVTADDFKDNEELASSKNVSAETSNKSTLKLH